MTRWNGTWKNEVGSQMTLAEEHGAVTGTYHTHVGRPDSNEGFPIAGQARGDMVAWTVDFGEHGSIAAWAGRMVEEGVDGDDERITTLWHLVRDRTDDGEPLPPWASTMAGAAVFRRSE